VSQQSKDLYMIQKHLFMLQKHITIKMHRKTYETQNSLLFMCFKTLTFDRNNKTLSYLSNHLKFCNDRQTDMKNNSIGYVWQTDRHKKKCVGVFLVKIFGRERWNENIIVSGPLKIILIGTALQIRSCGRILKLYIVFICYETYVYESFYVQNCKMKK